MMSKNLKFFPFLLSTPPLMTIGTLKEMEKCEICILELVEIFPQKFGLWFFPFHNYFVFDWQIAVLGFSEII